MPWYDEVLAYIGFGAADEALLRALHVRISPRYPEIVDHFYEVLQRHEGARAAITDGDAQIKRLKLTLLTWLDSGMGGDHGQAYLDARLRIGRRHVEVGLASRYMFTAIDVMRRDLRSVAIDALGRDHADLVATCDAVDKLLDLELAIMMHSYERATEERLVERERGAVAEKLRTVQRLSAGLAHEVRNPLNAAQLQLQLLERRLKRTGVESALLDVTGLVGGEIRRLSALLQEFLDFARPAQLSAADADVVGIVRQVIELCTPAAAEHGIQIVLTGASRVEIECDAGKVHQIVHNLLANAVDAARTTVTLSVEQADDDGVVLRVGDDGEGISDKAMPHVFEPFFSTKPAGTGMGLAITYSLVALHAGEITAHNDGGAQLTVRLPRRPPPAAVSTSLEY